MKMLGCDRRRGHSDLGCDRRRGNSVLGCDKRGHSDLDCDRRESTFHEHQKHHLFWKQRETSVDTHHR